MCSKQRISQHPSAGVFALHTIIRSFVCLCFSCSCCNYSESSCEGVSAYAPSTKFSPMVLWWLCDGHLCRLILPHSHYYILSSQNQRNQHHTIVSTKKKHLFIAKHKNHYRLSWAYASVTKKFLVKSQQSSCGSGSSNTRHT